MQYISNILKEMQMNTNKTPIPVSSLLNNVNLTDVERIRAEALMLRGEYIAGLMLRGIAAVSTAVRSIKLNLQTKNPPRLGPTV